MKTYIYTYTYLIMIIHLLCLGTFLREMSMDDFARMISIDFVRRDIADTVIVVITIHARYITRYDKRPTLYKKLRDHFVYLEFIRQ